MLEYQHAKYLPYLARKPIDFEEFNKVHRPNNLPHGAVEDLERTREGVFVVPPVEACQQGMGVATVTLFLLPAIRQQIANMQRLCYFDQLWSVNVPFLGCCFETQTSAKGKG